MSCFSILTADYSNAKNLRGDQKCLHLAIQSFNIMSKTVFTASILGANSKLINRVRFTCAIQDGEALPSGLLKLRQQYPTFSIELNCRYFHKPQIFCPYDREVDSNHLHDGSMSFSEYSKKWYSFKTCAAELI